jgi:hypothetical protein
MRYAKLSGGVVIDVALASEPFGDYTVEIPDTAGVGYTFNGSEFAPPAPPAPAPLVLADYVENVQRHMDAAARGYGYDSILSAVTYADEPAFPQFQTEGTAMRAWRSTVWAACYSIMADVEAQTRTAPTIAELIAELPSLTIGA